MTILKEELNTYVDNLGYGFYKEYYPNSSLISKHHKSSFTHLYEYDEHSRLKLELITEYLGGDIWEILYKNEYIYFEGGCRILNYRIGFKKFSEVQRVEWIHNEMVELPDIIHEENELLFIKEMKLSIDGQVTSLKCTDLTSNKISEYKYIYDDLGRLINKKGCSENQNIEYIYDGDVLDYSLKENMKTIHSYGDFKNEIERKYIYTNEPESTPLVINFNYIKNELQEIIIDFSGFGCLCNFESPKSVPQYFKPELGFNGFVQNEENYDDSFSLIEADYEKLVDILKLPSFHYIGDIDNFWRIGFRKIHAKYNSMNDIDSITFLDKNNLILDKIFFFHNDNFHHNCIEKKKTTDCFKIIKGQIEKIFSHKYYY
jgi:YD repeat-containing protein